MSTVKRKGWIANGIGYLPLTQGKVALLNPEDLSLAESKNWYAGKIGSAFYAKASDGLRKILLHRFLLGVLDSTILVDHKNRDTLDCRRDNIRICNKSQNACNSKLRFDNTSGHRGVSWDKANKQFEAYVKVHGKRKRLGRYDSLEEAAAVRKEAAIRYYGEFNA